MNEEFTEYCKTLSSDDLHDLEGETEDSIAIMHARRDYCNLVEKIDQRDYQKLKYALHKKHIELKIIRRILAKRNRKNRMKKNYAQCFVEVAKKILDKELLQTIKEKAHEMSEQ